jgi:hypothetical protein
MVVFPTRRADRDNLEFQDWCLCSRAARTPGAAKPRHRVPSNPRRQVRHTARTRALGAHPAFEPLHRYTAHLTGVSRIFHPLHWFRM